MFDSMAMSGLFGKIIVVSGRDVDLAMDLGRFVRNRSLLLSAPYTFCFLPFSYLSRLSLSVGHGPERGHTAWAWGGEFRWTESLWVLGKVGSIYLLNGQRRFRRWAISASLTGATSQALRLKYLSGPDQ